MQMLLASVIQLTRAMDSLALLASQYSLVFKGWDVTVYQDLRRNQICVAIVVKRSSQMSDADAIEDQTRTL